MGAHQFISYYLLRIRVIGQALAMGGMAYQCPVDTLLSLQLQYIRTGQMSVLLMKELTHKYKFHRIVFLNDTLLILSAMCVCVCACVRGCGVFLWHRTKFPSSQVFTRTFYLKPLLPRPSSDGFPHSLINIAFASTLIIMHNFRHLKKKSFPAFSSPLSSHLCGNAYNMNTHTHTRACTHAHTNTHTHAKIPTCPHMHITVHTHTHANMRIHSHTQARTHAHTETTGLRRSLGRIVKLEVNPDCLNSVTSCPS